MTRRVSARELRKQEAARLDGLDRRELAATLGESTWRDPANWAARLFFTPVAIFMLFVPLAAVDWAVSGENPFNTWIEGPPGFFSWLTIVLLLPLFWLLPALVAMAWRRPWLRLDATGFTRRGLWLLKPPPLTVYRWDDCGEFTAREVPVSEGGSAAVVECAHFGDVLVINQYNFGEPSDLVTILNAYRTAFSSPDKVDDVRPPAPQDRKPDSPAGLRKREARRLSDLSGPALREAAGEITWTASTGRYKAAVWIVGLCGVAMIVLFATAFSGSSSGPDHVLELLFIIGCVTAVLGAISGYFAYAVHLYRHPPQVRLEPSGITITGKRLLRRSPQVYSWAECGPFTVHTISGDADTVVARCQVERGHLKLDDVFGDPYDLVTILNAYRSVYGSKELR